MSSFDSLYDIARQQLPNASQAEIRAYADAILARNPHAFVDGDINRLRLGVTLQLPGEPTRARASQGAAVPSQRTSAASRQSVLRHGPVVTGETPYGLARRYRGKAQELDLKDWATAIVLANPAAFPQGPGSLIKGATLTIPDLQQARTLIAQTPAARSQAAAMAEDGHGDSAKGPAIWRVDQGQTFIQQARQSLAQDKPQAALDLLSRHEKSLAGHPEFDSLITTARMEVALAELIAEVRAGKTQLDTDSEQLDEVLAEALQARGVGQAETPQAESSQPAAEQEGALTGLANAPALGETESVAKSHPFRASAEFADARGLLENDQAREASALLQPLEGQYAGDADFDYLYGVALIDGGSPEQAIFPLQRAANTDAKNLGIRLDLGRAYFESGENESARTVFQRLRAAGPPPRAATVIDSYLSAIERRAARYETRLAGALGLQSGFDTNANSATEARQFAGFELDDLSRSQSSPYANLRGELEFSSPLTARWRYLGRLGAQTRQFSEVDQISSLQYRLGAGLEYRQGDWQTSLVVQGSQLRIDGEFNNQSLSLANNWTYQRNSFWSYGLNLRFGALRFDEALSLRDVDQVLAAANVTRRLAFLYGTQLQITALLGQDAAVEAGSPNDRDLLGFGLNGVTQLTPGWQLAWNNQWLTADYGGLFFEQSRRDTQLSAELGLNWTPTAWPQWLVRGAVMAIDNRSDIALFDYDRLDASLSLRRWFD